LRRGFLALLACGLALAGCATDEDALDPCISLANVSLARAGLLRQDLLLDLRVGNPNNFEIPIDGLTLKLDIDGAPFAEGFSNERMTIPRLAEVSIPVRASADTATLLERIFTLGSQPEIHYRLYGLVYVPGVTGSRRVPYERQGKLALPAGAPPPQRDAAEPLKLAPL
jgi:LEA14-like dessication related protein